MLFRSKIPIWFEATATGHYELACAQLCGLGHYRMRGEVTIETQEEFDKFLKERAPPPEVAQKPPPAPTAPVPGAPAQPAPKAVTETPKH